MDLTDILFSKPFIGSGGGGGGSNVETATIVISIADGTPEITSGEFPDWCTAANSDNIFGKTVIEDVYTSGDIPKNGVLKLYGVLSAEGLEAIGSANNEYNIIVAKDLSVVVENELGPIVSGTLTITLIYMPEE